MAGPEDDLARLEADGIQPHTLPSIDSAIDKLTTDLAAFCFDQLERSLALGDDSEDHEVGRTNVIEDKDELRVRSKLPKIYKMPMLNIFRSRRLWWRRHAPPMHMR